MSGKLNALLLAVLYTAIIGVGMYVSLHWAGYRYGDPQFVRVLVWVELVLLALSVFWVKTFWSWPEVGVNRVPNRKELLWLLPPVAVLGYAWFVLLSDFWIPVEKLWLFPLVGFTTLLVGISEELVFRGVVLRAFLKNGNVWVAMGVSSVAFSLLHSVNYFAGNSGAQVMQQLMNTFVLALVFYAPLAIRLGAIWPLMIFHWLWDFILIGGSATVTGPPVSAIGLYYPVIFVEAAVLWVSIWKFPPAWLRQKAQ